MYSYSIKYAEEFSWVTKEEARKQIEKLEIELREGYTQIKTSYISCDANSFRISMLYDGNYEIVNNEILELVDDSEIGLQIRHLWLDIDN